MAPTSADQPGPAVDKRRALLGERFGEPGPLVAERFRTRRRHDLAAKRCDQCHKIHDQDVDAGRPPQPIRLALPDSNNCDLHYGSGS